MDEVQAKAKQEERCYNAYCTLCQVDIYVAGGGKADVDCKLKMWCDQLQ